MNRMNLLPPDLRPGYGRSRHEPPGFRLLALLALLAVAAGAYLTMETARLQAYIEEGCARLDILAVSAAPAGSGAAVPGMVRPLIPGGLEPLDGCVPPEVRLTGLKFYAGAGTPEPDGPPALTPPADRMEITGVAASGQAVGYLLTALEQAGPYTDVELGSLNRQEDGEFAFTILGRLSL